ncbi:MAG: glycosyltransferase family 2 protein [bacterium]
MAKYKYSVIVPVFNEAENVEELHARILQTMDKLAESYEVIFVDDGSTDDSVKRLSKLMPVKIVVMRKNFGQTAALDAGFKAAQGEIYITMDGDLQNPPEEIPKLLAKMDEGFDIVSGWRHNRKDSFMKNFLSRGANVLRKFLINDGIQDSGCSLKTYRSECFDHLTLFGEMHRFIPAVLKLDGYKIGEVKVEHHSRKAGVTKYNWKRVVKGFLDMISVWFWRKYASRPLHLFGGIGILFTLSGSILGLYLFIARIMKYISLQDSILPLLAVFLVVLGVQFLIFGIIADINIKTYYSNGKTNYSIKEVIAKGEVDE